MSPDILDGDYVIFRVQPTCESGDICPVLIDGTDATIKEVIKRDGVIILQPRNREYKPMVFTGE